VFALLGMSNWTHRWYDPRGRWDADHIAEAFIALLERGYLVTPAASQRDLARRLTAMEKEIRGLRAALDRTARDRPYGTRTMSFGRR